MRFRERIQLMILLFNCNTFLNLVVTLKSPFKPSSQNTEGLDGHTSGPSNGNSYYCGDLVIHPAYYEQSRKQACALLGKRKFSVKHPKLYVPEPDESFDVKGTKFYMYKVRQKKNYFGKTMPFISKFFY